MIHYLEQTKLLNYNHSAIQDLIRSRQWSSLSVKNQIRSVYNYVRDEIELGYNRRDDIPASEVLQDGYGQCNTKGILFMALLRALGIPCRIHGFTIYKQLQKGAMNSWYYRLSPDEIIHSWIEVMYQGNWLNMEGFIIDLPYLNKLQQKFKQCSGSFCGYGVATDDFQNPAVFWDENDTYVQKEGIVQDFGTFVHPDQFFSLHPKKLSALKIVILSKLGRHLMNRNVRRIRRG